MKYNNDHVYVLGCKRTNYCTARESAPSNSQLNLRLIDTST